MWKVIEPIWFNEISVIYILMQRGFWDSVVHQQSVCWGKIVFALNKWQPFPKKMSWKYWKKKQACIATATCDLSLRWYIVCFFCLFHFFLWETFSSQNGVLFSYSFFFCIGTKNNLGRMFIQIFLLTQTSEQQLKSLARMCGPLLSVDHACPIEIYVIFGWHSLQISACLLQTTRGRNRIGRREKWPKKGWE